MLSIIKTKTKGGVGMADTNSGAAVRNSILNSTKKVIGIMPEYTDFDDQLILYINTVFSKLWQLGVGPEDGFSIEDESTTWNEYLDDNKLLNDVKTFMHFSVKLMFDPPQSSSSMNALNELIKEYEWRINIQVDPERDSE